MGERNWEDRQRETERERESEGTEGQKDSFDFEKCRKETVEGGAAAQAYSAFMVILILYCKRGLFTGQVRYDRVS